MTPITGNNIRETGQTQPVVPVSRRETYTPRSPFDELYFADWPNNAEANPHMHKYDLRHWLVGYAIFHGWTYQPNEDHYSFQLLRDGATVNVELIAGGLHLYDGKNDAVVKTSY